jgi:uncharacterized protein YjlB
MILGRRNGHGGPLVSRRRHGLTGRERQIAHRETHLAAGQARVIFGGPNRREVAVQAGDVVVISAGVGHSRKDASDDLLVVRAYPGGADYGLCRPDPSDPVQGREGPLLRLWG